MEYYVELNGVWSTLRPYMEYCVALKVMEYFVAFVGSNMEYFVAFVGSSMEYFVAKDGIWSAFCIINL